MEKGVSVSKETLRQKFPNIILYGRLNAAFGSLFSLKEFIPGLILSIYNIKLKCFVSSLYTSYAFAYSSAVAYLLCRVLV